MLLCFQACARFWVRLRESPSPKNPKQKKTACNWLWKTHGKDVSIIMIQPMLFSRLWEYELRDCHHQSL